VTKGWEEASQAIGPERVAIDLDKTPLFLLFWIGSTSFILSLATKLRTILLLVLGLWDEFYCTSKTGKSKPRPERAGGMPSPRRASRLSISFSLLPELLAESLPENLL
jgi:hypothetical protein